MLQVLVIETDPDLRLARALRRAGYSVTTERPEASADRLLACEPDLVVVDLSQGLSFDRFFPSLRERVGLDSVPYLLVVPREHVAAIGRHTFVGDFLPISGEPLQEAELLARVRRLARAQAPHKDRELIEVRGLEIDREGYEVRIDREPVELTYQEFLLLSFLAANPGKAFTRQQLLDRVWGYNYFGGTRTVDIHIRRIRAKLGPRYDRHIQTIRQVGYKFIREVRA